MLLIILLLLLVLAFGGGFAVHALWLLALVFVVLLIAGLLTGLRF